MAINHKRIFTVCLLLSSLNNLPTLAVTRQELIDGFSEVRNLNSYKGRPAEAGSRQEAFELLKDYCREMVNYHNEMATMFKERHERYKKFLTYGVGTPQLDLFLKGVLGVVVRGTPPEDVLQNFISRHNIYLDSWSKHLAVLTNEDQVLSNEASFKPPVYLGQAGFNQTANLCKAFYNDFMTLTSIFTRDFGDLSKLPREHFSICQIGLDELWSLRYTIALLLPWAKPDDVLEKEQTAREEARQEEQKALLKQQKKRERKKQQKARKKQKNLQLQSSTLENAELSVSKIELTTIVENRQEQKLIKGVQQEAERDSPLLDKKECETTAIEPVIHAEQSPELLISAEKKAELETFNLEEFVRHERDLSNAKKIGALTPPSSAQTTPLKTLPSPLATPSFPMDKKSFNYFMDLFEHRNLAFTDFVTAFENGLAGKVHQNKGGSMRAFQSGKFSFTLHKPHGHKGTPMFYDDLRQQAIHKLEILGVTKTTIFLGK